MLFISRIPLCWALWKHRSTTDLWILTNKTYPWCIKLAFSIKSCLLLGNSHLFLLSLLPSQRYFCFFMPRPEPCFLFWPFHWILSPVSDALSKFLFQASERQLRVGNYSQGKQLCSHACSWGLPHKARVMRGRLMEWRAQFRLQPLAPWEPIKGKI